MSKTTEISAKLDSVAIPCANGRHDLCDGTQWFWPTGDRPCDCECHGTAEELSDEECAVVARFGIHPEDEEASRG